MRLGSTAYVRFHDHTSGYFANCTTTVYPKKYAHGFVVLCFVVVMQSLIMNPHEIFIHIHQGCFAGTGSIVRLPQCQWSKPDGYGKISQCITTTKHNKAKTVCIFLGIYCNMFFMLVYCPHKHIIFSIVNWWYCPTFPYFYRCKHQKFGFLDTQRNFIRFKLNH